LKGGAAIRVQIVILNWNGAEETVRCLQYISAQTYRQSGVLVIDNGSRRADYELLREKLPSRCGLMRLRSNRGFAAGMNSGIRTALAEGADYIWLLNNDAFPEADCLERLVTFMDWRSRVTIASPKLMYLDGTEQHAGGSIIWSRGEPEWLNADSLTGPTTWGRWLTGAAMFLRVADLRAVGLFDTRLFAYYEDVDLCMRVVRAGGELQAVPEARCHHGVGMSTGGGEETPFRLYLSFRNNVHFIRRYVRRQDLPCAWSDITARSLEWAEELLAQGKQAVALATVGGLLAGFRGEYGCPVRLESRLGIERCVLARIDPLKKMMRRLASRLENNHRA
jgi:GT2 family glycosyltransferase